LNATRLFAKNGCFFVSKVPLVWVLFSASGGIQKNYFVSAYFTNGVLILAEFFFEASLSASVFSFGRVCWFAMVNTDVTNATNIIWEIKNRCKKDFRVKFLCWFMVN